MARLTRRVYVIDRYKLKEMKIKKDTANKEMNCAWCGENFKAKGLSQTLYFTESQGIVCYNCAFVQVNEIQQYGFWLRFASEHFIPCDECQEKLHKMITSLKTAFCKSDCIILEEYPKKGQWRFVLRFLSVGLSGLSDADVFIPCGKCQSEILKKFDERELHIGSDEKPLIELWRRWEAIEN